MPGIYVKFEHFVCTDSEVGGGGGSGVVVRRNVTVHYLSDYQVKTVQVLR